MAKTYQYSYLGECYSRQVEITDRGTLTTTYNLYDSCCGSHTDSYTTETIRATLDSTAPVPIDVWFSYVIHYQDPWTSSDTPAQGYVTIPAGQLYAEYTFYYWASSVYQNFCPGGGCALETTTTDTFAFMDQPSTPSGCQDPSCALGFTGVTVTAPSQRGFSDGSIYAGVTGTTGTTISWYLNTILQSGTATTHTFSGLTSGNYFIKAVEADCSSEDYLTVVQGEFRTGDFNITSPVDTVKAVENPIILSLRTATNSGSPAYSVNTFTIDGTISNVQIDFAMTFPYEYNATFLSKGYPDRSTYFLESTLKNSTGVSVGTNTTTEIATSLAECFQKDAILSRIYFITSSGTTITLKAKAYGEGFDLSATNVTITGSNVTLTNVTPGISQFDGQIISNYSLYAELFVNESVVYGETPNPNDYYRIAELELPFSSNNSHQFDLAPILKNFVDSPYYDLCGTGVTYLPNYITNYFCKYGEKYPLIENTNTKKKRQKGTTNSGWVVNAALDFESENDMSIYFPPTGYTIISGLTYLNTAPDTKYSHREGKEFLYFPLPMDYGYPVYVSGNIHMYNGAIYNNVKFFDIMTGTTNAGGVLGVAVDYDALGLSTYESTSKIRKVDIQIRQTIGGVSGYTYTNSKSYLLEIDEQPKTFGVVFLNKLGTYETYTFTGELVESQEIARNTYQKSYEVNNNGAASVGFEYNSIYDTDYTKIWTANTGIIDEANFDYIMGMLQSNKIYRCGVDHRNYLIPVSHTATKSTNTNEYSVQVVFKETINENNVSR